MNMTQSNVKQPITRILYSLVACLLLGVLVDSASANDEIDEIRAASSGGLVKIEVIRGSVRITGWDRDEIRVVGVVDDLAEKFIFEVGEKKTLIKVKIPRHNVSWGDGSDLEIHVPYQSRVDFKGVSTEVAARNVAGGLRIKTISGEISSSKISDRILLSSISGEISLDESNGILRASTVSGNLVVESHKGEVELESVSGEIKLLSSVSKQLRVSSVSGDIEIISELLEAAIAEIESVSGDIDFEMAGDEIDARVRIDGGMGGEIDNDLTSDEVTRSMLGQERLDMTVGRGTSNVTIRTMSADVRIE